MTLLNYLLIAAGSLAAIYGIFRLTRAVRVYLTFRGNRLVSCPENHRPAAVRVAAGKAALETMVGDQQLRLSACSRWPERQDCPQECLAQIEEAPKACLVWTIINRWYQGQVCAYCRKPFGEIHWHDHPPALVNREHKTVQWNEIPAENLQDALGTHRPVCWSCHMAETFRREHPELVVDRPSSPLRMNLYH
jgi:hypothetical protein